MPETRGKHVKQQSMCTLKSHDIKTLTFAVILIPTFVKLMFQTNVCR